MILEVSNLTKRFGGLVAVNDVTFQVPEQAIISVIGPNGAGKTTFFNMITGIYTPDEGKIVLSGKNITGLRPDLVAAAGIARTFQNIRLFSSMTALENVLVARHSRMKAGFFDAVLRTAKFYSDERAAIRKSADMLDFVGLKSEANNISTDMPYGHQRRLEIARALATDPKVVLLDEPAAGMNPKETEELKGLIRRIRDELKITVVLIEHDMRLVMSISDNITVLNYGSKLAEGLPEDIRNNNEVREAYLGRGHATGEKQMGAEDHA